MDEKKHKSFDLSQLAGKQADIVSSKEALKDVTPFDWSEDVLNGNKKVLIECGK